MLCVNDFHCDNSTHLNCKMQLTRSPCYKCHDLLQVQILLSAQRFRNPLELRQARGVLQLVVPHQLWVLLPRGLLCLHQSPGSWQRNPSGLSSFGNHCTKANDYVKTIVQYYIVAVWPDLGKFRLFGKKIKSLWAIFRVSEFIVFIQNNIANLRLKTVVTLIMTEEHQYTQTNWREDEIMCT